MSTERQDLRLRAWLASRDPGEAPARLRAAVSSIPDQITQSRFLRLASALTRVFGSPTEVRLVLMVATLIVLAVAIAGAALLLSRPPFPPRGLIAYVAPRGELGVPGVRLIAADGSGDRAVTMRLDDFDRAPRWSPDGLTLLFVRLVESDPLRACAEEDSIVLYDPSTATERVLAVGAGLVHAAEWSPSSGQIGFLQVAPDCRTFELGVLDVTTGRVATQNVGGNALQVSIPGSGRVMPKGLTWTGETFVMVDPLLGEVQSNDGRLVAVAPLVRDIGSRLEIVDRRTGDRLDLGAGSWPAWSPDDMSVAFVQPTEDIAEVGAEFHDRLAVAEVATGSVRILGEVLVPSLTGGGGVEDATPPLFWTDDGRGIYWVDWNGAHIVEVASGHWLDLPEALDGCADLQWQPLSAS